MNDLKNIKEKGSKVMRRLITLSLISTVSFGGLYFSNYSKNLQLENIITLNCKDNIMLKSKKEKLVSYEDLINPTQKIKDEALSIVKNSKTEKEMIDKAVNFVKSNFSVKDTNTPFQLLKNLEESKKGDCNELTLYLISLIKEIEKNSGFKFEPKMIQVYITDKNEHTNHAILKINVGKSEVFLDITSNEMSKNPLLYRELNDKEIVANYYEDLGSYYGLNANYKLGEHYLRIANKLNPNSPSILYNLSKILLYQHKTKDSLKYAKELIKKEPNWIYSYILMVQIYYEMDDYKKMEEFIKKAEKVDKNNKIIEMYKGIVERYKEYNGN